ncbi:S8 family serine peptidase [Roseivivax isoporae]|uniref:Peptidase S8/S53 domain-containing protein n=1 Tax=Roseivivax isoporae LMG 25204 TaxID=1449351 RepID=X7FGC7_9RHOB|nr:S8 family serine peptidase [Roseivivax isoporae]ETX31024.1 hypothetical protein RISW2_01060 [Roseivivax isoporae LMG 25204]
MPLAWSAPQSAAFHDAYLDWSRLLRRRRDALVPEPGTRNWFEPVFLRLDPGGDAARAALRDMVADPAQPVVMDAHEAARLARRIADPAWLAGAADDYALYRRFGTPDALLTPLGRILDTGSLVDLDPDTGAEAPPLPGPAADTIGADGPVVAVIDDGIAMLNRRFRRARRDGTERTRFHAVWLQSDETLRGGAPGMRQVRTGQVLEAADIDALLARGPALDEAACYARLSAALHRPGAHRPLDFGESHGTHVTDLCAGADPCDAGDPARDWPLLGVQLPSEAVEDTSGTRFEGYMVQALRWILMRAHGLGAARPVIVNVSLGMLAGPKDGTRFAEDQMAFEARQWEAATGQPVRLVLSFGNDRRTRQVARRPLGPGETATFPWRVQPGDRTASYVEVMTAPGTPSDALVLTLTAPDGTAPDPVALAPGTLRTLDRDGRPVARLYHVPDRARGSGRVQRAHHVIALGPTEALVHGEPQAPSGGWTIAVTNAGPAGTTVALQIQRGDSLATYRPRGRQSYFDAPGADAWDPETRDWRGLSADGAVTRAGTHSELASVTARQVYAVGAARWPGPGAVPAPAGYSAEGADWSVPGPQVAGTAEDGVAARGVIAAGTLSESARPLNGSSAAAARVTRALALSAARLRAGAQGPHLDDLDPDRVGLVPVPARDAPRLGQALVDPRGGARRRFDPAPGA